MILLKLVQSCSGRHIENLASIEPAGATVVVECSRASLVHDLENQVMLIT